MAHFDLVKDHYAARGKDAQKAWMDRFQDFQERLKGGEEIDFVYRQAIASQKRAVSAIGKQRGWMAKGFTAPPAGEVRQRDLRDIVKTMKDNLAIKAAQKRIAERNAQERRAALARMREDSDSEGTESDVDDEDDLAAPERFRQKREPDEGSDSSEDDDVPMHFRRRRRRLVPSDSESDSPAPKRRRLAAPVPEPKPKPKAKAKPATKPRTNKLKITSFFSRKS